MFVTLWIVLYLLVVVAVYAMMPAESGHAPRRRRNQPAAVEWNWIALKLAMGGIIGIFVIALLANYYLVVTR